MSRGVLFIGGMGPNKSFVHSLITDDDVICAADSGLDVALSHNIRPNAAVGDMDSISDHAVLNDFAPDAVVRCERDKDCSDTEIGIAWLRRHSCYPILMLGGGEGRLDHTLALLKIFESEAAPNYWYTSREAIRWIKESTIFFGKRGDMVSFYPVGHGPWKIASRGLHWEINDVPWDRGAMSLSNRISHDRVELEVFTGSFLLIRNLMEMEANTLQD